MKGDKIKLIIMERWKFYLVGYLVAFFAPIILYGIPGWQYLFPIRIIGIAGALGIGTALYYGSKKIPVFEGAYRSIKYALIMVALMLFAYGLKEIILSISGFDITPFIGIQKPSK